MGNQSKGTGDKAVKLKYIEWLKMPKEQRVQMNKVDKTFPANKKEFAKKYGINRVTLYRWEEKPEFQKLLQDEKFRLLSGEEFAALFEEWKVKAETDFKVFKQLVEWSGVLDAPKVDSDADEDAEFFRNMSDAELEKFLAEQDELDEVDDE